MSLRIYLYHPRSQSKKDIFWQSIIIENEILANSGLPFYKYEYDPELDQTQLPCINCKPFDFRVLQYVAAEFLEEPDWVPGSRFEHFYETRYFPPFLHDDAARNKSHLICHSFAYGNYIPVDFGEVDISAEFLEGRGSSINLQHELEALALKLKLELGEYTPDFDLLYNQRCDDLNDLLWQAELMLLYLYNMTIASIKYNLIIDFSG